MTTQEQLDLLVKRDRERRFSSQMWLFLLNFVAGILQISVFVQHYPDGIGWMVAASIIFILNVLSCISCVHDMGKIVKEGEM